MTAPGEAKKLKSLALKEVTIESEHWLIDTVREYTDGTSEQLRLIRPMTMVMHRCAEYGIEAEDHETLALMIVLEADIPPSFWKGEEWLLKAKTLERARMAYLREIRAVEKVLSKDSKSLDVLERLRQGFIVPVRELAIRSLGVVLERHRNGAQVLDPDVARALSNFERAISAPQKGV